MAKYKVGDGLFYYDGSINDYKYGKVTQVHEDKNVFGEEIIVYKFEDDLKLVYSQNVYGSTLAVSLEFMSRMQRMEDEYNKKERE